MDGRPPRRRKARGDRTRPTGRLIPRKALNVYLFGTSFDRRLPARGPSTESTASRVRSSESGAIRWRFRFHEGIRRTTLPTGLFLLLGGAASVAPTMALAASLGYANEAQVVALEVGIVFAFCVAGLLTARWILTSAQTH